MKNTQLHAVVGANADTAKAADRRQIMRWHGRPERGWALKSA